MNEKKPVDLEKLKKLKKIINSLEYSLIDYNLSEYDRNMSYSSIPKLYDDCPHCNVHDYTWIKEVLSDAVLKVKCNKCGNNFYKNFSK